MSDPRDAILARAKARELKPIEGVDWAGQVFCRRMSVAEMEAMAEVVKNRAAAFLVFTICDAKGQPVFTDADIPALAGMTPEDMHALYDPAAEFNKLGEAAAEDLEKN